MEGNPKFTRKAINLQQTPSDDLLPEVVLFSTKPKAMAVMATLLTIISILITPFFVYLFIHTYVCCITPFIIFDLFLIIFTISLYGRRYTLTTRRFIYSSLLGQKDRNIMDLLNYEWRQESLSIFEWCSIAFYFIDGYVIKWEGMNCRDFNYLWGILNADEESLKYLIQRKMAQGGYMMYR